MPIKIVHFLKEPQDGSEPRSGFPIRAPAFSLLEMLVVISISTFLFAVSLPLLTHQAREAHFKSFASRLTGTLSLARRYAQIAGTSVRVDFTETEQYRFRVLADAGDGQWRPLAQNVRQANYSGRIRNQLPAGALPHPTQNKTLTRALSSTHAPFIIFGPRGSSSGTLVFSDGEERAVCAVISSQTGRIRVFLWRAESRSWQRFF